ncbi:PTS sugar transporter subunit IIA, partial [Parabacteroides distasonis]
KEDLLTIVLNNAVANYQLDDSFVSSVKNREEMTSTYFGNGVAAPHALTPISDTTFVSVAILNNDVAWDNQNMVRIVLLVSIA